MTPATFPAPGSVAYFAVWEHQNGAHGGYVWGPESGHEPYQSRYAVGYCSYATMGEALASLKRHRQTPCNGGCEAYLRRKGVQRGITFLD